MSYSATGLQALFPVYLSRLAPQNQNPDEYNTAVAQNETNLNQNLETLYQKLAEMEAYLAQSATNQT